MNVTKLLEAVNTFGTIEKLGLANICQLKHNDEFDKDYYKILATDLGVAISFKSIEDDDYISIFISLKYNPGEILLSEEPLSQEPFALNFYPLELSYEDYEGFEPELFTDEYDQKVGKLYSLLPNGQFLEIKNPVFIESCERQEKKVEKETSIKEMYNSVKKSVISQDDQIKQILTSVYKNQKLINSSLDPKIISKLKENIIVYGPTGTGKTEILSQIAKLCGVPIVIEDITTFTETGYVGRSIPDMLADLVKAADGDIKLAQKGILVIDEFDKLASNQDFDGPSRTGVQRSLLKVLDGGTITCENKDIGDSFDFDTSNLTVVALGAFDGIKQNDDYSDVSGKDFIDYGIMREVMGRFSKFVTMNHFTKDDYKAILLQSESSPLNTYKKMFKGMGINFTYDDNLIDYVVDEAEALDSGARGLKTVFDGIISDSLFDIFASGEKEIHLNLPTNDSKSYLAKKKAAEKRKTIGFI